MVAKNVDCGEFHAADYRRFFLVSARRSRGSGHWDADDYDVRLGDAGGQVVGRIFRSPQASADEPWFWTITARFPQRRMGRTAPS